MRRRTTEGDSGLGFRVLGFTSKDEAAYFFMVSSLVNLNITIVPSGPVIRLFAKSSLGSEGEIRVSSDSGFRV